MVNIFKCLLLLASLIIVIQSQSTRKQIIQKQLLELYLQLKGKNICILTNPTAVDGNMNLLFERIIAASSQYNFTVKCFFAPQHGLRGDKQDGKGDEDYIDPQTGINVYSLYGVRNSPSPSQLAGINAVLYDIQDVGVRYYTFMWTLTYTMEVLSKNSIQLIVFDRPNPLGRDIEGCPLNFDAGLIGRLFPTQKYTIPIRYGLTIGEFVKYISQYIPSFNIKIIQMPQLYTISESQWVISSPNMPTLGTVHVYSGMALFEDTSVSEGRGTTKPFQITGSPKVQPKSILQWFKSNNVTLSGAYLRQSYFIPTFNKYAGQVCGGVEVHVYDPSKYKTVETALYLLKAYLEVDPTMTLQSSGLDKMFGRIGFSKIIQIMNVNEILSQCKVDLQLYRNQYQKYWIYKSQMMEQ